MVAYHYDFRIALVKGSPNTVAANATVLVYDPADTAYAAPVTVYSDPALTTIVNLVTDAYGIVPDFWSDKPDLLWKSGALKGGWATTTSRPGLRGATGAPGPQGIQGAQGNPGLNGAGTNAEVAPFISGPGPTKTAVDSTVAEFVGQTSATRTALDDRYVNETDNTTALAGKVSKGELSINARDYGVTGDGTTDDRAALLNAANAAVALGYPLVIPSGFTCALASTLILPAGLRLNTNGAKFQALAQTGRAPQVQIASNTTVTGGIFITTLGGINGSGLTIQGATNVRIDVVDVESTLTGQGSANVRDNALNINGSSYVTIDRVRLKNYDFPLGVENVPNLTINWIECDTYVKALWLRDTPRLRIHGGWVRGVSPNASYLPGHNGVLVEATAPAEDIRINNVTVYDAQEHGFRTSGPAQIKNIWFNNCAAINCTGTGFKILGSLLSEGVYNENVYIINGLVEDCGNVNQNTCGFLIQMAKYVKVVSPIVRNRNKTSSGHTGIRMGGVYHIQITDPDIINPSQYGIWIDSELANVSDVKINGANIDQSTGWCVYMSNGQASGAANNFNNIEIEATCSLVSTAGGAFYAGRGAYAVDGTWTGFNRLTLRTHDNIPTTVASGLVAGVTASFFADIVGKKNGTTVFRNGSKWLDTTTGNSLLAKAGAWATL